MVNPRRVAVIPARGGSKRIKRKNIIDFHGKPLMVWTIDAALNSGLFDAVIVSTDDEEIASIASEAGALVPFLREKHADDITPISVVTAAVLQQLQSKGFGKFDVVAQLMANCPLRDVRDIQNAIHHFESRDVPSQISCFRYGWMNPWWAVKLNEQGEPAPVFQDALKTRSQDLPPLFCPTGAIWVAKPEALEKAQSFYCPGHTFLELSWKAAIDIDDHDDLEMARSLFSPCTIE